jgi:arabinogalactan oligomer/maltooligosaccharide transport system substrate-binding protein
MKRTIFVLVSTLVLATMLLAACGPAATEPIATGVPATEAPATEAPAEVIEVTFWHAYGTGSAEEIALANVLAQAAIDLPQYKINVLQVPFNDIFNKYRTDVAAGGGPDMFIAPNDSLGDDARAGLIADLASHWQARRL